MTVERHRAVDVRTTCVAATNPRPSPRAVPRCGELGPGGGGDLVCLAVSCGNTYSVAERVVRVAEVKALKTRSGNTRFVLRADDGEEYTTFKEAIARQALAAEGMRARIEFHEQERDGFRNVYLDRVEALDAEDEARASEDMHAEEVAWKTALDAAPWLLGDPPGGGVSPDELFEKLEPFKQRVVEDIRDADED
jgi:hypothetical protein